MRSPLDQMGPSWACATMPPLEHKIIAAAQQALTSCLQATRTAPLFMAAPIWQAHRARRGLHANIACFVNESTQILSPRRARRPWLLAYCTPAKRRAYCARSVAACRAMMAIFYWGFFAGRAGA